MSSQSLLDELREALCKYGQTIEESRADYDVMQGFFDTFDAFVGQDCLDQPIICPDIRGVRCPAYRLGTYTPAQKPWCLRMDADGPPYLDAPTNQLCPVLNKEGE